jgi:hypothetical protein
MIEKMKEIVYKKVGRKYVPINDPHAWDGLSEGVWIVTVKPGVKTAQIKVSEDFDGLSAALETFRQDLIDSMHEASIAKPAKEMTKAEKKHWDEYVAKAGKDVLSYFSYAGLYGIADNAIKLFNEKINSRKNKEDVYSKF